MESYRTRARRREAEEVLRPQVAFDLDDRLVELRGIVDDGELAARHPRHVPEDLEVEHGFRVLSRLEVRERALGAKTERVDRKVDVLQDPLEVLARQARRVVEPVGEEDE